MSDSTRLAACSGEIVSAGICELFIGAHPLPPASLYGNHRKGNLRCRYLAHAFINNPHASSFDAALMYTRANRYTEIGGKSMKYMLSWFERPQGSPLEYENAQKRILDVFSPWKPPANF